MERGTGEKFSDEFLLCCKFPFSPYEGSYNQPISLMSCLQELHEFDKCASTLGGLSELSFTSYLEETGYRQMRWQSQKPAAMLECVTGCICVCHGSDVCHAGDNLLRFSPIKLHGGAEGSPHQEAGGEYQICRN